MPAVIQAGEHSKGCRGLATLASRAWQRAARACAFGWGGRIAKIGSDDAECLLGTVAMFEVDQREFIERYQGRARQDGARKPVSAPARSPRAATRRPPSSNRSATAFSLFGPSLVSMCPPRAAGARQRLHRMSFVGVPVGTL